MSRANRTPKLGANRTPKIVESERTLIFEEKSHLAVNGEDGPRAENRSVLA